MVDDGSRDASAEVARSLGASVAVRRRRQGTGGCGTEVPPWPRKILAFIDSDCAASEVARGSPRSSRTPRWSRWAAGRGIRSLGARSLRGGDVERAPWATRSFAGQAGTTFYLPSCNLLVRRQAFAASRGFREELHVGEDVDLTWRLRDAGGKIVYTPRGRVFHEHRSRLWPFLRRRFQYGTSEGLLQLLHPERRKKMVLPVALAAAAALAVLSFLTRSWPFVAVGAGVLLVDAARLSAKLRRERLRLPFRAAARHARASSTTCRST